MEQFKLLEDFINNEADKNLNFTIKTWKKSTRRYVPTSITNLPVNAPRMKNFMSRNGLNHEVVYTVLGHGKLEIYIRSI